ncbi:MAG: hypothetical protein HYT07_02775 [Candidatus Levybacteria bacterium]|nr:hypothetical protein [Candidatus Levybacteria bacterium]
MVVKRTILLLFLAGILAFPQLVKAAPVNNPIFATIVQVEQLISDAISNLSKDIDDLSNRVSQNEDDIEDLKTNDATMSAKIEEIENKNLSNKIVFGIWSRRGSFFSTSITHPHSVKTPDEITANCPENCLLWVNYDVDTRNTVGGFQHLYHIYIDDIDQAVFNQTTMTTANAAVPLAVNGVFPVSAGNHTVSIYVQTYGGVLEQHESHLQVLAIEQ